MNLRPASAFAVALSLVAGLPGSAAWALTARVARVTTASAPLGGPAAGALASRLPVSGLPAAFAAADVPGDGAASIPAAASALSAEAGSPLEASAADGGDGAAARRDDGAEGASADAGRRFEGAARRSSGGAGGDRATLIVQFRGVPAVAGGAIVSDLHAKGLGGGVVTRARSFLRAPGGMNAELARVGLTRSALSGYKAKPIATYSRINGATIELDGDAENVARFRAEMESRGHLVHENRVITVAPPQESSEGEDLERGGAVGLKENAELIKADKVMAYLRELHGLPGASLTRRVMARAGLAPKPVDLKIAVGDTGIDPDHDMLKGVAQVNATSSADPDDENGHGTWCTSLINHLTLGLAKITHYKIFAGDSATTDDILRYQSMMDAAGHVLSSNSWGDSSGDPSDPTTVMMEKLAAAGMVIGVSAGNSGPGGNTIGAPAIGAFRAPNGAPRLFSVAAADRFLRVAFFSSRGPGSQMLPKPAETHPHVTGIGVNTLSGWLRNTMRAISGTSMSAPQVVAAVALLCLAFGVGSRGEKLDAVVRAVMETATVLPNHAPHAQGVGLVNVEAAFERLWALYNPGKPSPLERFR